MAAAYARITYANSPNPIICRFHFYVASDKQKLISDALDLRGNKGSLGMIPVRMTIRLKLMKKTRVFGLGCEVADIYRPIYICINMSMYISLLPPPPPTRSLASAPHAHTLVSAVHWVQAFPLRYFIDLRRRKIRGGWRRIKASRPTFDIIKNKKTGAIPSRLQIGILWRCCIRWSQSGDACNNITPFHI